MQRHDGEDLIDGPDVRHGLEHRQVDEIFIGELFIQLVEDLAVRGAPAVHQCAYPLTNSRIERFGTSALFQRDDIVQIHGLRLAQPVHGIVITFHGRASIQTFEDVPQILNDARLIFIWRREGAGTGRLLAVDHVGDQHGVVRGHGATGFGNDIRVWQIQFVTQLPQAMHHVVGVFLHRVIDGAETARARAFVIDAQATADIDGIQWHLQVAQLRVVTCDLTHAALNVADVGDLRTQMTVQQLQAVEQTCRTQALHQTQGLRGIQTEFGLFTTGVLPLAGADGGQPHAQTQQRLDPKRARFLDDQIQLGKFFHHNEDAVAQAFADQRQADIFTILVTITDDGATRTRQRQHGHQLGLAAGLQADPLTAMAENLGDHALLLIHLDGIDRGVAALIAHRFACPGKGPGQRIHAIVEDIGEAHQYRQGQARVAAFARQRIEIYGWRIGSAAGPGDQMAAFVDVKIAAAPVFEAVGGAGLVGVPHRLCTIRDRRPNRKAWRPVKAPVRLYPPALIRYRCLPLCSPAHDLH